MSFKRTIERAQKRIMTYQQGQYLNQFQTQFNDFTISFRYICLLLLNVIFLFTQFLYVSFPSQYLLCVILVYGIIASLLVIMTKRMNIIVLYMKCRFFYYVNDKVVGEYI